MNRIIFFCLSLLFLFSPPVWGEEPAETLAEPAVYADSIYWRDWYSPNPDWRADVSIGEYNRNTRIPDLVWVKYEGAYTQGLRIRPIAADKLEQQVEAGLINLKRYPTALEFEAQREKTNARFRTVRVRALNADGAGITEISFKMKAVVRNAGANLVVNTGLGAIDTAKDADPETKCADGFKAYKIKVSPRREGTKINDISIVVDELASADAQQEFLIIDLMYKYAEKRPYVKDLAPRVWAIDDGTKPVGGVYAYMNSKPADAGVEIADLPVKGWTPRDKEKDKNVRVENIKVKLPVAAAPADAQAAQETEVDAVRFTITKGDRAYWICPAKIDGLKFNTMSLLYKIEVPAGVRTLGDATPAAWGWDASQFNKYFDNFGIGYLSATHDVIDWHAHGVCRSGAAWMRQKDENVGGGWNVFAWDTVNDYMTGNKDFSREAVTHWTVYYDSRKIPDGQKVVITIANPKAAAGIMRTGGDMDKFREFQKSFAQLKYDYSDSQKYLAAPQDGRLPEPLPIMRGNMFEGEIIVSEGWGGYPETRQYAAEELRRLIQLVCAPINDVPILRDPTDRDNVKIFVGGWNRCKTLTDDQKKAFQEDVKAITETPGAAVRTIGKNIFLFGGNFQYSIKREAYPGTGRGSLSAVYMFMENNTDLILAGYNSKPGLENRDYVFTRPAGGNWSIVWGDGLVAPPAKSWFVSGSGTDNTSRNYGTRSGWHINPADLNLGVKRNKSVNHWFGWGARDKTDIRKPNEKWGLGEDGQRMFPDCYTGHPCLINVLEDAKTEYVESGMSVYGRYRDRDRRYYEISDMIALWLEDTLKICVCDKCTAPIRLPDGTLVRKDEQDFRSTQFHAQTSAMIQAWNVYLDPNQLCETIAYFWEMVIPRCPISRQIQPRICPYVRKNYKVPIYAPINDEFWRQTVRWGQIVPHVAFYEYYLGVNFRPWTDVNKYDLAAELDAGIRNAYCYEGDSGKACAMERWVLFRQLWTPDADPMQLRKYYIRRTYREAAPDMEKFYFKLQESYYQDPIAVEFEDSDKRMGQWALWAKSDKGGTLADELTGYLADAVAHVRHPVAKQYVEEIQTLWLDYLQKAKEERAKAF